MATKYTKDEFPYVKGEMLKRDPPVSLLGGVEIYRKVAYRGKWARHVIWTQAQAHKMGLIDYMTMGDLVAHRVGAGDYLLVYETIVKDTVILPAMVVPVVSVVYCSKKDRRPKIGDERRRPDVMLTLATKTWKLYYRFGTGGYRYLYPTPTALMAKNTRKTSVDEFMETGLTAKHLDFIHLFTHGLISGELPSVSAKSAYTRVWGAKHPRLYWAPKSYYLDFAVRCAEMMRITMSDGSDLKQVLINQGADVNFIVERYKAIASRDEDKNELAALDRLVSLHQMVGSIPEDPNKAPAKALPATPQPPRLNPADTDIEDAEYQELTPGDARGDNG